MLSSDQKSNQLYKHFLNVSDTRDNRDFYEEAIQSSFCVRPDQLLMYGDIIPRGDNEEDIKAIRKLNDGEYFDYHKDETTVIHVVQCHKDYPLTKIDDGTDNAFKLVDSNGNVLQNIIPFNYYSDLYNYNLKTSTGKKIYFGVGDWVLDTYSGVLKFYGDVPPGVDHNNPPTLSFYQYVGGTGFRQDTFGFEGVIIPITDWTISKGTYLVNHANNINGYYTTLENAIIKAANVVQDNYAGVFGFDGSDNNEGIAYSLGNIIGLTYTATKDAVKGYDDSTNSDIGVLLSRKSTSDEISGIKITYCSPNLALGKQRIHVLNGTAALSKEDSSNIGGYKSLKNVTKLSDSDGNFIIIEGFAIGNGEYEFTVEETETSAVLLYWDRTEKDYLPFVTNEENSYNFGFPIVAANGRIPPSVSIGQLSLGTNDSITPDYYGPRNYTVTIAVETGSNIKSADYVVRNRDGFYLNDIFERIKADFTDDSGNFNFKGTIFLRSGKYQLSEALDLTSFNNLVLLGEDKATVSFDNGIKTSNRSSGLVVIKDITVKGDITHTSMKLNLTLDNIIANSVISYKYSNNLRIQNSSLERVLIDWITNHSSVSGDSSSGSSTSDSSFDSSSTNDSSNGDSSTDTSSFDTSSSDSSSSNYSSNITGDGTTETIIFNNIIGSVIKDVSAKTGYTFYLGNTITDLHFSDVPNDIVKDCFINRVYDKPSATQLMTCTVINFENVPFVEIPHMAHFPVYSQNSNRCIEYAKFDNPFELVYGQDENLIKLKINPQTLSIDDEGRLTTALEASQITVKTSEFIRNPYYEGKSPSEVNPAEDLQTALNDLYSTKADLNPNGKVPLEQLPDSVAYGGLLLVGTWSFEMKDEVNGKAEENYYVDGGAYPIYSDKYSSASDDHTDDDENNTYKYTIDDTQVNGLQPGWFWIVASSKKDIDKPAAIQKAALQEGDTKALEFTAGDWIIWNGTKFEKLDRAYQDVAYMVLPVYTTGEHLCWSWRDSEEAEDGSLIRWGTGALSLGGETIAESFDMINQELRKLWVKHPAVLSNVTLKPFYDDYKTVTFYRINQDYLVNTIIETSYDKHKDTRVSEFRVMTPITEPKWKSGIFVGGNNSEDKCTLVAAVDGVDTEIEYTPTSQETNINDGVVHISGAFDPFNDEIAGNNYWKAVYVDFTGNSEMDSGNHKFQLGMTDITPKNKFTSDAICQTPVFGINIVEPYDINTNDVVAEFTKDLTRNTSSIEDAEFAGVCSGIPTVTKTVNIVVGFTVEKAIGDFVNADRCIIEFVDKTNDRAEIIPEKCITLNQDMETKLWNISVHNYKYEFPVEKVSTKQNFAVRIYDVYNNYYELPYPDSLKMNIYPALNEDERVISGKGIVPMFRNNQLNQCGYPFDSSVSLSQDETSINSQYDFELMKLGRTNSDGELVAEYQWPYGVHNYIKNSGIVDYHDTGLETGDDVVINGDTERSGIYRWATFNKFWNDDTQSYESVSISDATGFKVVVNVDKDKVSDWDFDEYSMITKNVLMQVKIVDFTKDTDDTRNITKWIDINYPYDGFAEVGTEDNQTAMYAGTSDALVKRVTFGRNVYSGTILVRVGIRKGSGLSFKNISIKDII